MDPLIGSVRLFDDKSKYSKFFKDPILCGILPCNKLLLRFKLNITVILPIAGGICPSSLFDETSSIPN
jgi:hypothetical protein